MATTVSQNLAGLYMPDPAFCIHSSSILPKKAWTIVCKSSMVRFWPNASGPEASWCARIIGQLWQNANRLLPVSHWDAFFHRQLDIVQNQFWLTARKPACKNHQAYFQSMLLG